MPSHIPCATNTRCSTDMDRQVSLLSIWSARDIISRPSSPQAKKVIATLAVSQSWTIETQSLPFPLNGISKLPSWHRWACQLQSRGRQLGCRPRQRKRRLTWNFFYSLAPFRSYQLLTCIEAMKNHSEEARKLFYKPALTSTTEQVNPFGRWGDTTKLSFQLVSSCRTPPLKLTWYSWTHFSPQSWQDFST